jgi:hypothetical protein
MYDLLKILYREEFLQATRPIAYEGRRVWGLECVTHTENSVKVVVVELVTAYSNIFGY